MSENFKYGPDAYENKKLKIKSTHETEREKEEVTIEYKELIKQSLESDQPDSELIMQLVDALEQSFKERENASRASRRAREQFYSFNDGLHDYASAENELRDQLIAAVENDDQIEIAALTERLSQHSDLYSYENFDTDGTQRILKRFSSRFKMIGALHDDRALVTLDTGKKAFINKDGELIPGEYRSAKPYSEGKAAVQLENGRWTFIDETGSKISNEYPFVDSYSEGRAAVQLENDNTAFLDENGQLLPGEYKKATRYSDGFSFAVTLGNEEKHSERVLLNKDGYYRFSAEYMLSRPAEGSMIVRDPYLDRVYYYDVELDQPGSGTGREVKEISSFSEGKAVVKLANGKHTFIDRIYPFDLPNREINNEYKDARPFSEGKAAVQLENGRWKFINKNGEECSGQYEKVESYSEGKAAVQLENGRWKFINKNGEECSGQYEKVESYSEGKAAVQLENGEQEFVDHDGEVIHFKK